MSHDVPDWCRWRAGRGALLLVAPHGGSRDAAPRGKRGARVNDLHTAELAAELAEALDASLIANPSLDRNTLDLNRISQVRSDAPWFVALLERLLGRILATHARAEVVFLHGWNTTQAKCDIGIGHALGDAAVTAAAPHAGQLTASTAFIAGRLSELRTACAGAGIGAPFGERYPARHPNNVVQLFRRAGHAATPPAIAAWLAADRVDAVQLELGVPLRWPGAGRRAFTAAMLHAFGGARAIGASVAPPAPRRLHMPPPVGVQCYDPAAGLGVSARIDAMPGGGVASRVLLFSGGRRVALFTGEDPAPRPDGAGPHFSPLEAGFRLRFDGALLATDDGQRYLDLEHAFAASHLVEARLDLAFTPGLADDYGRVRGSAALDGVERPIDALGFARPAVLARAGDGWQSQLTLHAAFDAANAWRLHHQVPGRSELLALTGGARTRPALCLRFDDDPYAPCHIQVDDGATPLTAAPLGRVAIVRPLGAGRSARVTFGVARFTRAGAEGWGFYEYARALAGGR